MRFCVLFVTLLALSKEGVDTSSTSKNDQITPNETSRIRLPRDLTYHFYSQLHPRNSIKIKTTTIDLLKYTDFRSEKDSLFIIHGWKSNNVSGVNTEIRETILKQNDINVFVVDWSPMAGKSYISAKNAVVRVGQYVADFIRSLKLKYKLKLSKVKFVGFSLGAHIAGNAVIQDEDDSSLYRPINVTAGIFEKTSLCQLSQRNEVNLSDIQIYFYSTSNPNDPVNVDLTNTTDIASTSFSSSKPTVFVTHGWLLSYESAVCQDVKNALLKKHDVNVFVIDWNKISRMDYLTSFQSISSIGEILASLIMDLVENSELNLDTTSFIGHSFGAHIAGITGKNLNGKLDFIIGLDPAGPLFLPAVTSNRITAFSAKFVQIIHTAGKREGYKHPCGHADYYPNGGLAQRGCVNDSTTLCSHFRSNQYLAESIISGGFKARKCTNYSDFEKGICDRNEASFMGQYPIDKKAAGTYFLDTNPSPPWAKG